MSSREIEHFFSPEQVGRILEAIKRFESGTSGEIRVHFTDVSGPDPLATAEATFFALKMDQTAARNGVLFFLSIEDRQFAVYGDQAIDEKVPSDFWGEVRDKVLERFREDDFAGGMEIGIAMAGGKLAEYFPCENGDVNELPDDISFGGGE